MCVQCQQKPAVAFIFYSGHTNIQDDDVGDDSNVDSNGEDASSHSLPQMEHNSDARDSCDAREDSLVPHSRGLACGFAMEQVVFGVFPGKNILVRTSEMLTLTPNRGFNNYTMPLAGN